MPKGRVVYPEYESRVLADNPLGDPYIRELPVYLPPGYDESQHRYPVILVFAPYTGWGQRLLNLQAWDENIIQRMDRLVEEGEARPAILVLPNCFTRYGGSQYLNSSAVGRYEDYIIEELVPFVDKQFRTLPKRENRGVMGYSSGGYGALVLAMHHPDLFAAASSHSGDMFFEYCYLFDVPPTIRMLEKTGGVKPFIERFFGTRDKSPEWFAAMGIIAMSACYSPNPDSPDGFDLPFDPHTGAIREDVWQRWQAFDPIRMADQHIEALRGLRALYFDCGRWDEYNLFLGARLLHQILNTHNVPHAYEEFDGGHRHINWRYDISLPIMTGALAPQEND